MSNAQVLTISVVDWVTPRTKIEDMTLIKYMENLESIAKELEILDIGGGAPASDIPVSDVGVPSLFVPLVSTYKRPPIPTRYTLIMTA